MEKPVKNYEGYYTIDENGTVTSLPRNGTIKTRRVLKPYKNKGYYCVILQKNGVKKFKPVHRLVAEAFIPNPDNKICINHKDYNRINNNVDNLEWVTHRENTQWSLEHYISSNRNEEYNKRRGIAISKALKGVKKSEEHKEHLRQARLKLKERKYE